jgi:hypothetical protein
MTWLCYGNVIVVSLLLIKSETTITRPENNHIVTFYITIALQLI